MKEFYLHKYALGLSILSISLLFATQSFAQIPVRVVNQLNQYQAEEVIIVTIGDWQTTLRVTPRRSVAQIDFMLPQPGNYYCRLESRTRIKGSNVVVQGFGEGMLTIYGGEIMTVAGDFSQNPIYLTMQQVGILSGYVAPPPSPALNYRNPSYGMPPGQQSLNHTTPGNNYLEKKARKARCNAECTDTWYWCVKPCHINSDTQGICQNECDSQKRHCENICQ